MSASAAIHSTFSYPKTAYSNQGIYQRFQCACRCVTWCTPTNTCSHVVHTDQHLQSRGAHRPTPAVTWCAPTNTCSHVVQPTNTCSHVEHTDQHLQSRGACMFSANTGQIDRCDPVNRLVCCLSTRLHGVTYKENNLHQKLKSHT